MSMFMLRFFLHVHNASSIAAKGVILSNWHTDNSLFFTGNTFNLKKYLTHQFHFVIGTNLLSFALIFHRFLLTRLNFDVETFWATSGHFTSVFY
jgi:hypothetical protein